MTWVGFETTIPAFERTKTVHALDSAATVIGKYNHELNKFNNEADTMKVLECRTRNLAGS
jgi:hypothetical protein